ncbi:ATP-binding protein [Desulfovibrio mangrovi]|uniref:ATP-binding protein n=1 Tax=Desulfovibrio mangrovi TaxID=2976983 RepID=UPI00224570BF|nr:ATP-binding protein [Desulfovibrio mangrovi]UZP67580.1 ATP-binding protein [Desulfovibrio mangrovi]
MMKNIPVFYGIWARLLMAFGAIAAMTVLAVMTALFLLEKSSDIFATITERQLPELARVAGFAEIGGQIMAIAPSLASAADEEEQARIRADLNDLLVRFKRDLEVLEANNPQVASELDLLLNQLSANLFAMQMKVAERLRLEAVLLKYMERLRWLYSDLLGEIEPLGQDLNYNLDAELDRMISAAGRGNRQVAVGRLRTTRNLKKIVEGMGNNGDLLVSLLLQASSVQREAQVENLDALARDTSTALKFALEEFSEEASALTLRHSLQEIMSLAEGPEGVFAIKKQILASETDGQAMLSENRRIVGLLRKSIESIVANSQQEAFEAAAVTKRKLDRATWAQLGLVFLSLVIAACVLWFYVRGSIVARLNALGNSMRAIAAGDLDHPVPEAGSDEVGQMAAALRVFRDTARSVEEANAQAIIDNAAAGLVIVEPDGEIRFFNLMAVTLFAADPQGMTGSSIFSLLSEQDRVPLREAFAFTFSGGSDQIQILCQGVRSDGGEFPVEMVIRPIQQRSQRRLMVTMHDVTEREKAEELLRRRVKLKTDHLSRINERLRLEVKERRRVQDELVQAGKLAALGQLSAGIAHELNQPLSAIRYYIHNARLLLQRGQLDLHEENIGKISELSERMAKMINHLKSFARLPSNKLQPVDVVTAIDHALSLLNRRITDEGIVIERRYENRPHLILAEDIRLEQVLVNVVGNAIDAVAMQPADNRTVSLDIVERDGNLCIEVADSGPGIPAEVREAIFDPFYTTKEVGKGLGLGLSISYNIVKDMRGAIEATAADTGGTRFIISFQKVDEQV